MPDLASSSASDAVHGLQKRGIQVKVRDAGVCQRGSYGCHELISLPEGLFVAEQAPPPGTPIDATSQVSVVVAWEPPELCDRQLAPHEGSDLAGPFGTASGAGTIFTDDDGSPVLLVLPASDAEPVIRGARVITREISIDGCRVDVAAAGISQKVLQQFLDGLRLIS